MTSRETILRAWWSARRVADRHSAVTLSASAFAGYALEAADGDIEKALALIPPELEVFWSRARAALEMVAEEERRPVAAARAQERVA